MKKSQIDRAIAALLDRRAIIDAAIDVLEQVQTAKPAKKPTKLRPVKPSEAAS